MEHDGWTWHGTKEASEKLIPRNMMGGHDMVKGEGGKEIRWNMMGGHDMGMV